MTGLHAKVQSNVRVVISGGEVVFLGACVGFVITVFDK